MTGKRRLLWTLIPVSLLLVAGGFALKARFDRLIYPMPGGMPPKVAGGIAASLPRFEAALAKHAPQVLGRLRPGLSEADLAAIEARHGVHLGDELKALYRWRDGSPSALGADLIPGHRFVPLEEAIRIRDAIRTEHALLAFRNPWLPLLDDGAGDGYFFDPSRSEGPFFYHFAEDATYRFFPSLANFLAGAAECYESGIYAPGPDGTFDEDFTRSFALWPRYASWGH